MERHHLTGFLLGLVVALSLVYTALEFSTGGDLLDVPTHLDLKKLQRDSDLIVAIDRVDDASAHKPDREQQPDDRLNIKVAEQNRIDAATKGEEKAEDMDEKSGGDADLGDVKPVEKLAPEKRPELMPPLPVAMKEPPPVPVSEPEDKKTLRVLTDTPTPPDGWVAFMKWLTKTLVYPQQARAKKLEGMTTVTFIVETDGTVKNIRVKKSGGKLFDDEALRVMRLMKRWKPGIDHGKPCRSMVEIPVVFNL